MAQIPLNEFGRGVAVRSPRKGGFYLKRASYMKGEAPPHLESYREKFTEYAHECKAVMSGLEGNEKVNAYNSCISAKFGGKKKK